MNKKVSWTWLIGVLLLGGLIGFLSGQEYEKQQELEREKEALRQFGKKAHEENQKAIEEIKKRLGK